ncbi:MAG: LLM class F420-dependent oxidoreductase, partial [Gaiellales bacterium]
HVRRYAITAEGLGYVHLIAFDHVVGADPEVHAPWEGPYDVDSTFHEPFVLFGYLAAVTTLELAPSIIIMPQRQTALVAKQAAQVDLLAEGRFRMGVAVGWNHVEYEALGEAFSKRGRRLDEQIVLLRRLWTERSVTFEGEFDRITGAGLAPLPLQRPIPIWVGGGAPPAYRRMGRLADGWFPSVQPGPDLDAALATIARSAEEAGRDPAAIQMEGRLNWRPDMSDDEIREVAGTWRDEGATYLSVDTMGRGLGSVDAHLEALARVADALALR